MRFCYNNKIDDYTLSANSATDGYPVSNINDFQLVKQHRSTGDSAEWWKLAGSTTVINATFAYIAGHNISSTATVIGCVGGDVDNIASYVSSVAFTHDADIMVSFFTEVTHKYWWFKVTDSANVDELIKIGRLGLGTYLDWTPGIAINFPYDILDSTTRWMSKTGQIYSNEGVTAKSYTFDIPVITDTQRQYLETMYDDVKSNEPILWVPNENYLTRIEPLYCVITSLSFNHIYAYNYSASMGLMEAK